MVDKGLNEKEKREAGDGLKEVRELIGLLKDAGVQIPSSLTTSLNRLQIALDTEKDLGSAFEEASKAVAMLENDLNSACLRLDEEQQAVCEAKVARVWQVRNIKFALDPTNSDSMSAGFIRKTVQRYSLSAICRHWDYCRRQVGR
jgi:hypothetical protein